jgi:glutathionylspermidine synthase
MRRYGFSPQIEEYIKRSWEREDPTIYGRFDFAFDGENVKMLEYNADTPTSLLESSIVQWRWFEDRELGKKAGTNQFNQLHEYLVQAWTYYKELTSDLRKLHFTYFDQSLEDFRTCEYLADTAIQAGIPVELLPITKLGSDGTFFYDQGGKKISHLFKLYPYEWMFQEKFAEVLLKDKCSMIEPPWKALLSNKRILEILWELNPGHPNLLASQTNKPDDLSTFVSKPLLGREGVGIRLGCDEAIIKGAYGNEGYVYQERASLKTALSSTSELFYMVVCGWVVGDSAAGISCREDTVPVISNFSLFVPHYFVGDA